MKALLYCCKNIPYINKRGDDITDYPDYVFANEGINGKIAAECDFEVEKIKLDECNDFKTDTLQEKELCERSGLDAVHLNFYLDLWAYQEKKEVYGYAIHIKNLKIFDEPKELSDYYRCNPESESMWGWLYDKYIPIKKAPQNMMRVIDSKTGEAYVLISIRPEWLRKILNGEKTIEVRKKVLKEMK